MATFADDFQGEIYGLRREGVDPLAEISRGRPDDARGRWVRGSGPSDRTRRGPPAGDGRRDPGGAGRGPQHGPWRARRKPSAP